MSGHADKREAGAACMFPRCVDGDKPPYCGNCEGRETPYAHEYRRFASYLPWTCAWCGKVNQHFGVVCDRCHHYGQPPSAPTGHQCFWGYGRQARRCKAEAVRAVDTETTRGYYCAAHAEEAERLLSGSGR